MIGVILFCFVLAGAVTYGIGRRLLNARAERVAQIEATYQPAAIPTSAKEPQQHGHRQAREDANGGAPGGPRRDAAARAKLAELAARVGAIPDAPADAGASAGLTGEAPDLLEPILAWRGWEVTKKGQLLALNAGSGNIDRLWPPRQTPAATCHRDHGNRFTSQYATLKPHERAGLDKFERLLRLGYPAEEAARLAAADFPADMDPNDPRIPPPPPAEVAPVADCSCGYYAALELEKAQFAGDGKNAWGIVALWGKVQEHGGGYRAQYAYPVVVAVQGDARIAAEVGRLYGCMTLQSTKDLLAHYKSFVPPLPDPAGDVPPEISSFLS